MKKEAGNYLDNRIIGLLLFHTQNKSFCRCKVKQHLSHFVTRTEFDSSPTFIPLNAPYFQTPHKIRPEPKASITFTFIPPTTYLLL